MIYIKHFFKITVILSLCLIFSACNLTKPVIISTEDEIISNEWIYNKDNANNFSAKLYFKDSTAYFNFSDSKKINYKISGIYYFSDNILYITDVNLKHCFEFEYSLKDNILILVYDKLNIKLYKK